MQRSVVCRDAPMTTTFSQALQAVVSANQQYHKLAIIVGENADANTDLLTFLALQHGCETINLTLVLGSMLRHTEEQPSSLLQRLVSNTPTDTSPLFLDAIDILFWPKLQIDPYLWLRQTARQRLVCATWLGTYKNTVLEYAQIQHTEHKSVRANDVIVIDNSDR